LYRGWCICDQDCINTCDLVGADIGGVGLLLAFDLIERWWWISCCCGVNWYRIALLNSMALTLFVVVAVRFDDAVLLPVL